MSLLRKLMLCMALLALAPAALSCGDEPRYSEETIDLAARLPMQDAGRIKPLSTTAGFLLLRLRHTRSAKDDEGTNRQAIEWLLDVLFHPEIAVQEPTFRLDSYEIANAIGLGVEGKKKRDLWSYEELEGARTKLYELASTYGGVEASDRSPLQAQLIRLAHAVSDYERWLHLFDFARNEFDVSGIQAFSGVESPASFSGVLERAPALARELHEAAQRSEAPGEAVRALLAALSPSVERGEFVRLFAPTSGPVQQPEWASPGGIALATLTQGHLQPEHLALIRGLELLVEHRGDPQRFEFEMRSFVTNARNLAAARGELKGVDLEVAYYRANPFGRGLVLYLLAFFALSITWLKPQLRKLWLAAMVFAGAGCLLHTGGIVLRCILRSRPPISTLYETILFVGATAVLAALVMERIDRRRIAGALAPLLGALSLFLAMRFEAVEGTDTMPQLVAVLDTNFWLATHVTCITLGYSAGLLASALAHVWLLGKLLGIRKQDDAGYRALARMVYGALCFSLIFAVVGTILGGVWANESWGRFWGWDPKENGALMIVLAQLAILHARLGGYLRAFGLCVATVLQGVVVAFSWWGVNLLGVGLHSYGFTSGVGKALTIFYVVEGAFVVAFIGHQVWRAVFPKTLARSSV